MNRSPFLFLLSFVVALLLGWTAALAQPSGGPYGPIAQTYELPEVEGTLYFVAPDGDAEAAGTDIEVPSTLESVFARVVTGDAIILRGGEYRVGDLLLNQGILMQPYLDEQPILKGTLVATDWIPQRNGLWRTPWETLFPETAPDWWRRENNGHVTAPHHFNYDMVFIDGQMLEPAAWEGVMNENSFYIDYKKGYVYIAVDPTDRRVEITSFDNAITRVTGELHGRPSDRIGPVIKGIVFTQYSYRAIEIEGTEGEGPTDPDMIGKEVVGTVLENVTLSYCSRVGGYFRGDNLVIRNCLVTHTGMEGIYVMSSADMLLENNIVTQTNIRNLQGVFATAIKVFNQSYRAVVRNNLIYDNPNSSGLWYDVGNVDGLIYNNWVIGTQNGFFFEISMGAVCAGNVFVDCHTGIFVLNASDVEIYQNTLINSSIKIQRTTRSAEADHFGWHPAAGPDVDERVGHIVKNNLMVATDRFDQPLLQFIQDEALCGKLTDSQVAVLDNNVYVQTQRFPDQPALISWSPDSGDACTSSYDTLDAFRLAHPQFEGNGVFLDHYNGPLFQSLILGNYGLMKEFAGIGSAGANPELVHSVLEWTRQASGVPGAFPVLK